MTTRANDLATLLGAHIVTPASVTGGTATGSRWVCSCGAGGIHPSDRQHAFLMARRHVAGVIVAAGYEKRPDHVAEADALRKQVEG